MPRRHSDPDVRRVLDGPAAGERLLAWGRLTDGGVVVCTKQALHAEELGRIPWQQVLRAAWSEEFLDLVVKGSQGRQSFRLRFSEPAHVPAVVRERVEWSVVASHQVTLTLPDGRAVGAQVSARRGGDTAEISWSVVFDPGVDAADPVVRAAADEAVLSLRESLGL